MSFKRQIQLHLGALSYTLFLFCTSCSGILNESEPPKKRVNLQGAETQCLVGSGDVLADFIEGEATSERINALWNCLSGALTLFAEKVQGEKPGVYKSSELSQFLQTYFLKKTELPPSLMRQLMKIKRIFLGGSEFELTTAELHAAQDFIQEMNLLTQKLVKHIPILLLSERGFQEVEREDVEAAIQQLQEVMTQLSALLEKSGEEYEFSSFVVLIEEVKKAYGERLSTSTIEKIRNVELSLVKIKKVLIGPPDNIIRPDQWKPFLYTLAKVYTFYLRYSYFLKGESNIWTGESWNDLRQLVGEVFNYFGHLVAQKEKPLISQGDLKELIASLNPFWPELKLSETLIREVLKIKTLFLGGSEDVITDVELLKIPQLIDQYHTIVQPLRSYEDVYTLEWKPSLTNASLKHFEESQRVLENFFEEISEMVSINGRTYNLNGLFTLFTEVFQGGGLGKSFSIEFIQQYFPILLKVKKTLIGPPEEIVLENQWRGFLLFIGKGFGQYLKYHYFLKGNSVFEGEGWVHFMQTVDDLFSLFSNLLEEQGDQRVLREELYEIVETAAEQSIDLEISKSQLVELMKIKQLLIGGSVDYLDLNDFKKFPGLIQEIKRNFDLLYPQIEFLTFQGHGTEEELRENFERAEKSTKEVLSQLGQRLTRERQSFSIKNLPHLLFEIEKFFSEGAHPQLSRWVGTHIESIVKLKGFLTEDSSEVIHGAQWNILVQYLSHFYRDFLYYYYFVKGSTISDNSRDYVQLLDQALKGLDEMLSHREGQRFSREELEVAAEVLLKIFPDLKFDRGVISTFMKLKVFLVGGGEDEILKNEFQGLSKVLQRGIDIYHRLYPYREIYTFQWKYPYREKMEKAQNEWLQTWPLFEEIFLFNDESVQWQQIIDLVRSIEENILNRNLRKTLSFSQKLEEYSDLIKEVKVALVGGERESLLPSEVRPLFKGIMNFYVALLEQHYFLREQNPRQRRETLQSLSLVNHNIFVGLRTTMSSKEAPQITATALKEVLVQLDKKGMGIDFNAGIVVDTVVALARNIFPQTEVGEKEGVWRSQLSQIESVIDQWISSEAFLEEVTEGVDERGVSIEVLRTHWEEAETHWEGAPQVQSSLERLKSLLFTGVPATLSPEGYVEVGLSVSEMTLTPATVRGLNLRKTIVELLLKGYGENQSGMTVQNLENLYGDIQKLGEEAKVFDPRFPRVWSGIFKQGDQFVYSANGNGTLDLKEGVEVLNFVLSGIKSSGKIYRQLTSREGCLGEGTDPLGRRVIRVECFRESFKREGDLAYLPKLTAFLHHLSEEEWEAFFEDLENASRVQQYSDADVEKRDISVIVQNLQGIEVLLHRFDLSQDGILTWEEGEHAFPLVRRMLSQMSGFEDEHTLKALLSYFMKYRRAPRTILQKVQFAAWRKRKEWKVQADRSVLLNIFAELLPQKP